MGFAKAMCGVGFSALFSLITASTTRAAVYAEIGEAGQTLATAQGTGSVSGTPLTKITGNLSPNTDADLYLIQITNTSTFSATTNNAGTDGLNIDTELSVFDSTGHAIYVNDDDNQPAAFVDSTLPAGNSFITSLSPGKYYIAVSQSGSEAVNSNNQLLFATNSDTTAIRGTASGLNPTTLATFDGNTYSSATGAYEIDLTSAATVAVPEPSTGALIAGGIAMLSRRKKR